VLAARGDDDIVTVASQQGRENSTDSTRSDHRDPHPGSLDPHTRSPVLPPAPRYREAVPSGLLLIDKPTGLTSHDVVARARRALGTRKVGHAGTLDPLATGLLTLGVGSSTRLLTFLVGLDKTYETTIVLGAATTTDDSEGEPVGDPASAAALDAVTEERLAAAVAELTGPIQQVPSSVSAIKVDGRRAYDRVRAGEEVELAARSVTIAAFEVGAVRRRAGEHPIIEVDARIDCSSGTYIRALARDLGRALGVGGHLSALRRTRVGPFDLSTAVGLDALAEQGAALLEPAASVAERLFPVLRATPEQARDLVHGKKLALPEQADAEPVAAIDSTGHLVALVSIRDGVGRTLVGFPPEEG
jgi:tRNA pseudouridine55 synthase